MRVFYDPVPDQIWIEGQPQSFARRSLWSSVEDGGKVGIRMLNAGPDDFLIKTAFGNIRNRDGAGFASPEDVKAYLDAEFGKAQPLSFAFTQVEASAVWTIPHGLGFHPNVSLVDSSGDPFTGDPRHPSADVMTITFEAPVAGMAYLS